MARFELMKIEQVVALGIKEDPYDWSNAPTYVVEHTVAGPRIVGSDRGEPEDNLLYRDWKWVVPELNAAFEAGCATRD